MVRKTLFLIFILGFMIVFSLNNVFSEDVTELSFEQGKNKEAEQLQRKAVQMVNLLMKYGGTAAGKGFMKVIGSDCGWFRGPLPVLTIPDIEALKVDLEAIGFFEYTLENLLDRYLPI